MGHDALHVRALRQPPPQHGQHIEQLHERRERVDALRRVARGMRGPAVEGHPVLHLRGQRRPGPVVHAGVEHQRRVDVVEHPGVRLDRLAAPALLGGRAHRQHRPGGHLRHGGHRQRGAQARRRDEVVPARVPEAGQGVVLHQQRHRRPALARARRERGGHPRHAPLHGETGALQLAREQGRRPVLGEGVLGVGVQAQGNVPQGVGPGRHLLAQGQMYVVRRAGHGASSAVGVRCPSPPGFTARRRDTHRVSTGAPVQHGRCTRRATTAWTARRRPAGRTREEPWTTRACPCWRRWRTSGAAATSPTARRATSRAGEWIRGSPRSSGSTCSAPTCSPSTDSTTAVSRRACSVGPRS